MTEDRNEDLRRSYNEETARRRQDVRVREATALVLAIAAALVELDECPWCDGPVEEFGDQWLVVHEPCCELGALIALFPPTRTISTEGTPA